MISVIFYFQVHQPFRIKNYSFFDIGKNIDYFDDNKNKEILLKVAKKCYLPTNKLLLKLIKKHKGKFKVSFSISGTAIEQFKLYSPEVIESFKELVNTGCVELLNETFYHSLAFLYSKDEFLKQIEAHKQLLKSTFNYEANTFRNTELIYNNDIAQSISKLGFNTILTEGADKVLGWKSPNFVYHPKNCPHITLLTKNYRLSDDIAFRFSNKAWEGHPLTSEKFAHWTHQFAGSAKVINLFMDYETFGEHQWADTGIFSFLENLPTEILKHPDFQFLTPNEVQHHYSHDDELDIPNYISWADEDRDLSAWRSNPLQYHAFERIYNLEEKVFASKDINTIHKWRLLQTSDHFYYMCTKFAADGDVHKYFSPYKTPYDAYIHYQNVIADFEKTLITQTQLIHG